MGFFSKSKEEIVREETEAREEKLLKRLILFPGSVEEYANFRGYDVEVVDTERPDKGVFLPYTDREIHRELVASLIEQKGIEALVNVSFRPWGNQYCTASDLYGLPVRRKK